jgi:hypothetical protein
MTILALLLAQSAAKLGMGWGIAVGGIVIGAALVCFPWKRQDPTPEEHKW